MTSKVVSDTISMTIKVVNMKNKIVILTKVMVRKEAAMGLGNHLKEYRARLGVNQQELGSMVGASRQTISLIERGDYSPSVTLALKIAKVCNVTVEELFQLTDEES